MSNAILPSSGHPSHRSDLGKIASRSTAIAKHVTLRKLAARSAPSYKIVPVVERRVGTDTRTRPQGACRLTTVVCVAGSCWSDDRRGKILAGRGSRISLQLSLTIMQQGSLAQCILCVDEEATERQSRVTAH